MSGRETRDRQVLTLLVQLFGRDVMDRLAGAGFDAPAAMARAGADRLAAEAGIPLAIARRLAIVVEEAPAPRPATQPESEALPGREARPEPATLPETAAREERRPAKSGARKRGEPRITVEPATPPVPAVPPPAAPSAEPAASAAPSAASTGRGSFLDEGDPFVDDVALVSWMGLSSHQPDGRLAFTVSDTILDPAEEGDPPPADRDAAEPSDPERLLPSSDAPVEPLARPSTLSGSFWTFGSPAGTTSPSTGQKTDSQPPAATPRRRKHDGH